jgi:hypothetical protein
MLLKLKNYLAIISVATLFTFTACNNDKDNPGPSNATQAEEVSTVDNASAENTFDDAVDVEDEALKQAGVSLNATETNEKSNEKDGVKNWECATITVTLLKEGDITIGRKVVIDFGTEGCKIKGKTRKGKIIVTFIRSKNDEISNPFNILDRKVTTTFDGYQVEGVKVEGTKEVTTTAANNTSRTQTIKVTGAKLTFTDNTFHTWSSNRVRVYTFGTTPLNLEDDFISVTGTAEGTNRKGVNYSATTTSALIWKVICLKDKVFIPVQGTISIKATARPDATVDYGDGTCDNIFTITVNGQVKTIDASKKPA